MIIQRYVQRAVIGSVIVIASTAVYPYIRKTLRPMMHDLSKDMNYFLVVSKEKVDDMVREVKFERMKKHMDNMDVIDCEVYEVLDEEPTGK